MYKDPEKQREANKEAMRRNRAKGITNKPLSGITDNSSVIPQCETTPAVKRGKDIKCFEDLPIDVQETIVKMSFINGRFNEAEKVNRTARAINYQHLFPDRYYSTGIAI